MNINLQAFLFEVRNRASKRYEEYQEENIDVLERKVEVIKELVGKINTTDRHSVLELLSDINTLIEGFLHRMKKVRVLELLHIDINEIQVTVRGVEVPFTQLEKIAERLKDKKTLDELAREEENKIMVSLQELWSKKVEEIESKLIPIISDIITSIGSFHLPRSEEIERLLALSEKIGLTVQIEMSDPDTSLDSLYAEACYCYETEDYNSLEEIARQLNLDGNGPNVWQKINDYFFYR